LLKEIALKNFKTFRDVRVPLAPGVTVLVGANNSGKSNLLAALKLVGGIARSRDLSAALAALGGPDSVLSRSQVRMELVFHVQQEGETGAITVRFERDGEGGIFWESADGPGEFHIGGRDVFYEPSWHRLPRVSVHDFSVAALRAPAVVQRDAQMGPDGRDVAAVLDNLAGENPSLRDAIDEVIRGAAREVKRVVTRPGLEPGTKVLGIEERDGRVYGAEDISDGLLLFIGLAVAAQMQEGQPSVLAIEEPERGIHPRRIREVMDLLLRLTQSGTQVILTTHSPTLLDEFRDTPESVLIFERDEQGTHVTRLSDRPDWVSELKQGAPLGDLWYSGVLGGVPPP
jgi:predicted ATPase